MSIDRPEATNTKAWAVIGAGGRFTCEELMTGEVSLTAEHPAFDFDIAHELCSNGPPVIEAVDRLIETAYQRLIEKNERE